MADTSTSASNAPKPNETKPTEPAFNPETTKQDGTARAGQPGVVEFDKNVGKGTFVEPSTAGSGNLVEVTLAHPISRKADLVYLGLPDDQPLGVGTVVRLPREAAQSLIGAGLVQVNVDDADEVAAILNVEPSATSGN